MPQVPFGYKPIGFSAVPTNAGDSGKSSAVAFSSTGDVGRTNSNQADSMCHPHPLTDAAGPKYDPSMYEVEVEFESNSAEAPSCVRSLDY